ncbi:MAG TPA: 1-acyl-sn-glycerol-3-phosphate acyltransferase, partial [Phnomibacter sp.]|nr:1-acyl-sn-glycerol-3-phosphate acyltransferase [Phnomibacter sp.]
MKVFKLIFGRIWALWGLLIFMITLLIFVWPIVFTFLIPEPAGIKTFKAVSKLWMTIFLYAIGCPLKIYGRRHYQAGEEFVVVSNHRSLMDVPLLTPFFPGPNKTIAKRSMSRIPIFGWVYTRGSV